MNGTESIIIDQQKLKRNKIKIYNGKNMNFYGIANTNEFIILHLKNWIFIIIVNIFPFDSMNAPMEAASGQSAQQNSLKMKIKSQNIIHNVLETGLHTMGKKLFK